MLIWVQGGGEGVIKRLVLKRPTKLAKEAKRCLKGLISIQQKSRHNFLLSFYVDILLAIGLILSISSKIPSHNENLDLLIPWESPSCSTKQPIHLQQFVFMISADRNENISWIIGISVKHHSRNSGRATMKTKLEHWYFSIMMQLTQQNRIS